MASGRARARLTWAAGRAGSSSCWPSGSRRAGASWARLLIVQEALPPGNTPSFGKLLDLQMLVIGGRERTHAEYHSLLHDAGYELTPIVPTSALLHIIEGIAR